MATFASGMISVVASVPGTTLRAGAQLTASAASTQLIFQTTADTTIAGIPTPVPVRALVGGSASNLAAGSALTLTLTTPGINTGSATVLILVGGANEESDDQLRVRVLQRLRKPPMGGDADDYVAWAQRVPGVTRAWASPNEMGPGSCTLRFMMDDLRATATPATSGIPTAADIAAVKAYVDTVRPVTVRDFYVVAPLAEPVSFTITGLNKDTPGTRAAITNSVAAMIQRRARPATAVNGNAQPAQTIYAAWVNDAILSAAGVNNFDLSMADHVMPAKGSLAVLGSIFYG